MVSAGRSEERVSRGKEIRFAIDAQAVIPDPSVEMGYGVEIEAMKGFLVSYGSILGPTAGIREVESGRTCRHGQRRLCRG